MRWVTSRAASLRGDALLRAAVERWLQISIEACVDLAYLANRLGLAAGLRNILVHEYAEVDLEILAATVHEGLSDLRELGSAMGGLLPR